MDQSIAKGTRFPFIPGTKPSIKNSQLLISTGIPSLDHLIGGGLPIGSLFVVEEDLFGTFANVILRYFMAEGVGTAQPLFIGSKDVEPSQLVSEMPAVMTDIESVGQPQHLDEQMKIAWRYQNLKKIDSSPTGGQVFGNSYDLTKTMEKEVIEKADITQWYDVSCPTNDSVFKNSSYSKILKCIQETLNQGQYSVLKTPSKRQVLRIAIHSLGSRSWFSDSQDTSRQDLLKFLYLFRALLRYSYAVALITVRVESLENSVVQRVEHLSDIAIRLESFIGSERKSNPLFKDYHGMLHLKKLPALNTIAPHNPYSRDLVFKLGRKKLIIEVLHLPPEFVDTTQREQDETARSNKMSQSYYSFLDF